MEDIKPIIAKNIAALRQTKGLTQLELAEQLNYSDKAVSKWERGDSIPDITVLKRIADLFGVTLDYLVTEEHEIKPVTVNKQERNRIFKNRVFITCISILLVWLVATTGYSISDTVFSNTGMHFDSCIPPHLLTFVYAVPASMIVWLVFNSIWFNHRRNFLIVSILMWSLIVSVWLTLFLFGFSFWQLYLLGIPGQIIILFWSRIRSRGSV